MVLLVDIVHPMRLQSTSAPSVFPLALLLESPGAVSWLAVSIYQVLVEPLREHPYQVPVSKSFLAPTIVYWCGFADEINP